MEMLSLNGSTCMLKQSFSLRIMILSLMSKISV